MKGASTGVSALRWQVKVDTHTETPFDRGIYSIALRGIHFSVNDLAKRPKVMHICIDSTSVAGALWIEDGLRGCCIKSIFHTFPPGERVICTSFSITEAEKYIVSLACSYRLLIKIYNEEGVEVAGSGICLFDVTLDKSTHY